MESKLRAKTTSEVLLNYLAQKGNSGRQVYDNSGGESMTLVEPILLIGTDIGPDTNLTLSALYDTWTSASAQKFDSATGASAKLFDAATLASQPSTTTPQTTPTSSGSTTNTSASNSSDGGSNFENRKAINMGMSQKFDTWVVSPTLGYSTQVDYVSTNGSLTVAKNMAQDNFTLALSYHFARDSAYFYYLSKGLFTDWIPRNTDSYELSLTQILSTNDLLLVGVGDTSQTGFLAKSRNTVWVAGQRMQEILPSSRDRRFYTARYVHAFNETIAWHTDYRYYTDNWGITAQTIEPFLALGFADDDGLVRLGYRMHSQSASTYYFDSLSVPYVYMTSSSDLSKFSAQEASLLASYTFDNAGDFFVTTQVGGGIVEYQRSNGLDITIVQASIGGTL